MNKCVVSVVIVSYNTSDMTVACLNSVMRETVENKYEIIVFDNSSSDDSVSAIREAFGDAITLLTSDINVGFAVGNNLAAERATGDYILLLNPDTVVLDSAIDRLVDFAKAHSEAGIWGGRTLFGNGSLNPASCWSKQTLRSLILQAVGLTSLFRKSSYFNLEGIGGWNREGERHVDIVSGCFLLITRSLWHDLGGFRKEFFMYGEEADLCLRAKKLGAKPLVTSVATIIHYGGASEKVRADKMVRLLKAKMLLIQFHFSVVSRQVGSYLLYLWPLSRYLAHNFLARFGFVSSKEPLKVWYEVLTRKSEWFVSIDGSSDSK